MNTPSDQVIKNIKENLDKELESADANVGIMFGEQLFSVFKNNEWITLEDFGLLGTSLFSEKLPAYQKTHFAFSSWDLSDLDFKVGQKQN